MATALSRPKKLGAGIGKRFQVSYFQYVPSLLHLFAIASEGLLRRSGKIILLTNKSHLSKQTNVHTQLNGF